ncbi:MAG: ABC transporter permease [Rhodothermales bacterium]
MLTNYLKIALRNLRKHTGYSFINISGLAVGIACCVLIALYIQDERGYDRFHENADAIYRVVRERLVSENEWGRKAATPWKLGPLLQADFPQIQKTVRIASQERMVRYEAAQHTEERFFLADSVFFDVFTFPLVQGDPGTVLREPFSVVLTETTARKYFGEENPVGKVLTIDNEYDFTVTGVARDVPPRSHFHFDFLASLHSAETMYAGNSELFESWGAIWLYTYLLLDKSTDPAALYAQFDDFIRRHAADVYQPGQLRLPLQPLTDIHLHSNYDGEIEANGDATTLSLFALIAVFILCIACINFMNLATARSAWRAREISVRKVVGAHRLNLVGQFLGESILLSLLALVLAVMLVEMLLPLFNDVTGKALSIDYAGNLLFLGVLVGAALLVGLAAGSYPAFYLSAFRPVAVLKGNAAAGGQRGAARLRRGLVVFQFAITIVLLIATAVVYRQLQYVQHKKLGFDKEHLIMVYLNHDRAQSDYALFKEAFAQHPGVTRIAAASNAPPDGLNTWGIAWEGKPDNLQTSIRVMAVDYDFVETLGLELAEGRSFSETFPTDAQEAFLVNEAAVRQFGFEESIGQPLDFSVGSYFHKAGTIIGVVKDFHLASLHEEIHPVMLNIHPRWYDQLLVRIRPGAAREVLAFLEQQWTARAPEWPFEYAFLDTRLDALYRAEQRLRTAFGYFAGLAVLIACLGLFGLAAYSAEQRTKEIGIRKVFGAPVPGIVALLSIDFLKLVAVAFIVAVPVTYFAMQRWLESFAYRITIGPWVFVAAGLLALGIALLTVSYQSIKAALADPIQSLRYE